MNEKLESRGEEVDRLELGGLAVGDVVHITTGRDEGAFHYEFEVEHIGEWPEGLLKETRPDGSTVGPAPILVHGSGEWTDRSQNPVQKQDRALTIAFGSLIKGKFLVTAIPSVGSAGQRLVFDKNGQEITTISHTPAV